VYRPSDDSWLVVELLDSIKPKADLCMDLGCGSGVLGLHALLKEYCEKVIFIDIDEDALNTVRENTVLNNAAGKSIILSSDTGTSIRESSIDLVLANPPYLPAWSGSIEDIATEGGVHGYEAILYFIDVAWYVLKPGGLLVLVYSSLSNPLVVEEYLSKKGFSRVASITKNMFFETLYSVGVVKKHVEDSTGGY
jgi:release factor glutamine methyltransferase